MNAEVLKLREENKEMSNELTALNGNLNRVGNLETHLN